MHPLCSKTVLLLLLRARFNLLRHLLPLRPL